MKKMGIEGVGPKIILFGLVYAVIVYFASKPNSEFFRFTSNLSSWNWLIWLLAALGIFFWIGSAIQLLLAWRKKELMTTWFYRVFLNPLYNAFIFFIFPALSLYLNNWLYLGLSVVFVIAMELLIHEESDYLTKMYGNAYTEYKKKVWFKF